MRIARLNIVIQAHDGAEYDAAKFRATRLRALSQDTENDALCLLCNATCDSATRLVTARAGVPPVRNASTPTVYGFPADKRTLAPAIWGSRLVDCGAGHDPKTPLKELLRWLRDPLCWRPSIFVLAHPRTAVYHACGHIGASGVPFR